MTFLSPAALWALPLAAGPLLFHLLAKRQASRLRFSDLSLLQRALARALPRTRLKQWLLLLARTALILGLVGAYAGPVLEGAGGAAPGGLDVVLLIDASYSMGYREAGKTRFELARERGAALIRSLASTDRVAVAAFSDALASPLAWQAPVEALAGLSRARPGFGGTDLSAALRAAQEFLGRDPQSPPSAGTTYSSPRRRRAVVLLSDAARHGWKGGPARDPGVAWLALGWPSPSPNAFVVSAAPAQGSTAARPRLSVRAAGLPAGAAAFEVWTGGRKSGAALLKGAVGERSAEVDLPPPADAADPAWSGRVSLRPDALSSDDDFYFSFRHPARPRLLCLYGAPDFFKAPNAGFFLRELLDGGGLGLQADFEPLDRLGQLPLSRYGAVLLADFGRPTAAQVGSLESFVSRGGGLWVLPGARTPDDAWSALGELLPARGGALVDGDAPGLRPGPAAAAALSGGFDLSKVDVGRYRLLTLKKDAQVWLKSAGGYPLLVLGAHGRGRVALWASSLDAQWTNLALKPVFPAWTQAVAFALTGGRDKPTESLEGVVGRPLSRSWSESEAAPERVVFRSPDGRLTTVYARGRRAELPQPAAPGLYEMLEPGGARTVFAVNLDRSGGESDLAAPAQAPWKTLRPDSLVLDFRRAVFGRQARGPLLAAAAVCAVIELAASAPAALGAALILLLATDSPRAQQPAPVTPQAIPNGRQDGDAAASSGRFVWTQLKLGPDWDPYPTAASEVLEMLSMVTSVLASPQPRVLPSLLDPALASSPLLVLAGRQAPAPLGDQELRALRDYLSAGGFLWIEDSSGGPPGSFDRWVRRTLAAALPEAPLAALPEDHVVYKTFFLVRRRGGRVDRGPLEGVTWDGRTAVIYSRNDLLGAWVKDALGQPVYDCSPGGRPQCESGKRLALNIVMYALTGSYKADAVHQPYLMQKMRLGEP